MDDETEFFKSSFCADSACVEVVFRKSSFCGNGACVEVAHPTGGNVLMRDGKDPGGPVLTFTTEEWDAFRRGVAAGEFNTLTGPVSC
jgi:hypothetical protein